MHTPTAPDEPKSDSPVAQPAPATSSVKPGAKAPLIDMKVFREQHATAKLDGTAPATTVTVVALAKPKDNWIRTSPDMSYYLDDIRGIPKTGKSDIKLIHPSLVLPDGLGEKHYNLYAYVVAPNTLCVGFYSTYDTTWLPSMQRCIIAAQTHWIKLVQERDGFSYVTAPPGELAKREPNFSVPADAVFQMAFADHMIHSLDDPIIQAKLGLL
jgi:hypothetical protein